MDKFEITVIKDKEVLRFDVADYLHNEEGHCKFEVFKEGEFVASFQPDTHHFLHICKNADVYDEETLHLIADQLELLPHDAGTSD